MHTKPFALLLAVGLASPSPILRAVDVPERSLPIHGPFEVSLGNLSNSTGGLSANSEAPSPVATSGSSTSLVGVEPPGPQTPEPTANFLASAALSGLDPGIAAGNQYLLVSDNVNGVAVYEKTGKLLGPKPGDNFPNPFSIWSLFSKVKADIDPQLNYPKGLPANFASNSGIEYGDVRVMFDSYRKRFWIYAQAKNSPPWDPKTIVKVPVVKLARRNKAAVAVSKTEDPRDGFFTYWWNETIHNGDCNKFEGCSDPVFKTSGEGADYPRIGISPKYFVAAVGVNRRDPTFKTDTMKRAKAWDACESTFTQDGQTFNYCGPFYAHLMVVDADQLSKGCARPNQSGAKCAAGRSFGLFVDAKNYLTDRTEDGDFACSSTRAVRPVVMHGPVTSADAMWVNNFIDRSGQAMKSKIAVLESEIKDLSGKLKPAGSEKVSELTRKVVEKQAEIEKLKERRHYLTVWSLVGDNLVPKLYPIGRFTDDDPKSDWKFVLSSSFRDGKLYATFQECWPGAKGCLSSVRVLRVNTLSEKTEIDRTFGGRNRLDDNPSQLFDYSYPGIEANKFGDMVLVYTRYSVDKPQRQEVRFSSWLHTEPDIRPSRLLQAAEADYITGTDTSGIAVDPSGDEGVWIAQIFAAKDKAGNPYKRIAVGRVFGSSAKH
jgi:hypothetical protein